MQTEEILSVGIDIGTSTTQLIFSRMLLQNTGGFGKIPQIKVVSKEIIYQSEIYFTPLLSNDKIDGKRVNELIKAEYQKAGIFGEQLTTGAVIITGESSRKKNASQVAEEIAEAAGDFVVATAGPDLESVLAGKGAGSAEISRKQEKIVANLDIGGGTTNICLFEKGEVLDTACLDIGGRLVKISDGVITYISPKMKKLIDGLEIHLAEGQCANEPELRKLTDRMAELLAEAVGLLPSSDELEFVKTNRLLTTEKQIDLLTFSGGVSTCFHHTGDIYEYGDIGILLAESISNQKAFRNIEIEEAMETMRATVIGAGNYSMNISGSTVFYTLGALPLKNLPVVRLRLLDENDIGSLAENIHKAVQLYKETQQNQIALAMQGVKCPSFSQVQQIAEIIVQQFEKEFTEKEKLIVIFEEDIAKAVGQSLHRADKIGREIICIDGICCDSGDYVDLGEPIASGTVIPAIVKTLVFH